MMISAVRGRWEEGEGSRKGHVVLGASKVCKQQQVFTKLIGRILVGKEKYIKVTDRKDHVV